MILSLLNYLSGEFLPTKEEEASQEPNPASNIESSSAGSHLPPPTGNQAMSSTHHNEMALSCTPAKRESEEQCQSPDSALSPTSEAYSLPPISEAYSLPSPNSSQSRLPAFPAGDGCDFSSSSPRKNEERQCESPDDESQYDSACISAATESPDSDTQPAFPTTASNQPNTPDNTPTLPDALIDSINHVDKDNAETELPTLRPSTSTPKSEDPTSFLSEYNQLLNRNDTGCHSENGSVNKVATEASEIRTLQSDAMRILRPRTELTISIPTDSELRQAVLLQYPVKDSRAAPMPPSDDELKMLSIDVGASGGSLLERATAEDTLGEDKIATFIRQLLQALQHIHAKGLIHLDVKPENIMFSETGKDEIKLVDFGLSQKMSRSGPTFGTMGTPEFVSPEVVKVEPVSPASDVWSVGVMAFVMLSGLSPFLGDNDAETLARVAKADFNLDHKAMAKVSPDAKDFIASVLRLDPKDRLSVERALTHPWLIGTQANPAMLTTSNLKEFRYRHQWVERRIFTQAGPDSPDSTKVTSPRNAMEWIEPVYFPAPSSTVHTPKSPLADVAERTFRLHENRVAEEAEGPQAKSPRQAEAAQHPPTQQPPGQPPQTVPATPVPTKDGKLMLNGEEVDPNLYTLIQGEYRPIEDEIANRILSDISEEGSVASTEDLDTRDGDGRKPKSSCKRQKEREARMKALEDRLDRERTPTREDEDKTLDEDEELNKSGVKRTPSGRLVHSESGAGVERSASGNLVDVQTGAPIVLKPLHDVTIRTGLSLDLDDHGSSPSPTRSLHSPSYSPGPGGCGKSPVRLSPTKEHVMELVIALKQGDGLEGSEGPRPVMVNGQGPNAARQMANGRPDAELDKLMGEVEDMRKNMHQRRKDILSGNLPRDPRRPPEHDLHLPPHPEMDSEDVYWDSNYQTGPETYLLALRDPGLTARIRDYRRELIGDSATRVLSGFIGERNADITVRERRRYSDMMREDVNVAKSVSFMDTGTRRTRAGAVRRVQSDGQIPPPPAATCYGPKSGLPSPPVFQLRLRDSAFIDEGRLVLHVAVLGEAVTLQWFHNDSPLVPGRRVSITNEDGKGTLTVFPAYQTDAGVYSVSATNDHGNATCQARVVMGDLPGPPTRPTVELASDTEVFITWEPPSCLFTGHVEVLAYKLEVRRAGEQEWAGDWHVLSEEVDEEALVVRGLDPLGIYQFRLSAKNAFGFGQPGLPSRIVRTHPKGAPKLQLDILKAETPLFLVTYHRSAAKKAARNTNGHLGGIAEDVEEEDEEGTPVPEDRAGSDDALFSEGDPAERFQLESLIAKGTYSLIRNAVDKKSESGAHCIAKILCAGGEEKEGAMAELAALKAVQHTHVPTLHAAYMRGEYALIFQERLYETLTQRFCRPDTYNEDQVAKTFNQLFSALDWIHYKGIVHLNIHPENVMFTGKRTWNLKLIDFGSAMRLSEESVTMPRVKPEPWFSAPELVQGGHVTTLSDVWSAGITMFVLMSGYHPWVLEPEDAGDLKRALLEDKLDINMLFTNASQEALRFLTWALCKEPARRMRPAEALEHRWLSPHESMARRRVHINFTSNRLRSWAREYLGREKKTTNKELLSAWAL